MPLLLKQPISATPCSISFVDESDGVFGIWKVTESYNELLSFLPDNGNMYSERLDSFKSESRRTEFLAVRVLLFTLLNEEKLISYTSSGKPYFPDNSGFLSISHTKGYVAVIISKSHEVGIDIEQRGEKINRVAHKFVRDDEEYENHPLDQTTRRLLIWSAKEVMFKCLDTADVDFREHLRISFPENRECFMNAFETRTSSELQFTIHYMLHDDFVLTWTVMCQ